jgi:competence protein ComEA
MPAKRFYPLPLAILAPTTGLALLPAAGRDAQGGLPAGAGKEAVERSCTGCHEIDTVVTARRTRAGWREMVDDMTSRGATGSPEELASVVSYLTQFFGKINVNTAPAEEMAKFVGIAEKEAESIVEYRRSHGDFKNQEQLEKIPGVDAAKLHEKQNLIAFSE